jgi:hypothetical protein
MAGDILKIWLMNAHIEKTQVVPKDYKTKTRTFSPIAAALPRDDPSFQFLPECAGISEFFTYRHRISAGV